MTNRIHCEKVEISDSNMLAPKSQQEALNIEGSQVRDDRIKTNQQKQEEVISIEQKLQACEHKPQFFKASTAEPTHNPNVFTNIDYLVACTKCNTILKACPRCYSLKFHHDEYSNDQETLLRFGQNRQDFASEFLNNFLTENDNLVIMECDNCSLMVVGIAKRTFQH